MKILVGRKAICQFMGGVSWPTVKRLIKEEKLPVVQRARRAPMLLSSHAKEWQRARLRKWGWL